MFLYTILSLLLSVPPEIVTDTIPEASVSATMKMSLPQGRLASQTTSINFDDIHSRNLTKPNRLSSIVPNLHIPDYGSTMTSTIYMRGFGSRIDNPVIGLYVDDIPIIDKNSYDFDFVDIRRIDLFRGPQGTLFGRNAMTGLMSVSTLGPIGNNGISISAEGGPYDYLASGSYYKDNSKTGKGSYGGTVSGRFSNGYHTNGYTGKPADRYAGANLRLKYDRRPDDKTYFENIFSASYLKQGGYPYRQYLPDEQKLAPLAYNDTCNYRRLNLLEGVKLKINTGKFQLNSISSIQLLFDKMRLDQDFTTASMFTLTQRQRQGAITQEVILKPTRHPAWWKHQSGAFLVIKYNNLSAPVNFKQDGIQSLIIDNANRGIPDWLGDLEFKENSFIIASDFNITTYNTALYHESYFNFGNWLLTAGLRLDHEGNFMGYDSRATIHYRIVPAMTEYRAFGMRYKGHTDNFYFQLLPKISVLYELGGLKLFASITKGYKSGGFNTQIFSDILQNKMMNGMMEDLGVYMDNANSITAGNTVYKPETSYNYETGFKYGFAGNGHHLKLSGSLFYINCSHQQITVFPPGKSTGRMMKNAGKSHSAGAEAEISYNYKGLSFSSAFGCNNARFDKYSDGNQDYSGNLIPYSPSHTLYLRGGYVFHFKSQSCKALQLGIDYNNTGRIMWNEDNSLSQGSYGLLGVDAELKFKKFSLYSRADNILGTEYNVFYFKSIGNSFFQEGKPFRFIAGVRITL